jgi:hypothetical protein
MGTKTIIAGIGMLAACLVTQSAAAGLIYGPSARTQFENYRATLGDTLQTFDGFAAQTDLTTQIPGLTFKTTYKRFIPPPGPINQPVHVICSGSNPYGTVCTGVNATNRIISGTGTNGGATDGQSRYEIVFDTGMLRVGLDRIFNTFSLTRFYSGATLLSQHQNTANTEFVGYVSDSANLITRVEMDGLPCGTNSFGTVWCVGYSDNLFYGNRPSNQGQAPVPTTLALLVLGIAGIRYQQRKKIGVA